MAHAAFDPFIVGDGRVQLTVATLVGEHTKTRATACRSQAAAD